MTVNRTLLHAQAATSNGTGLTHGGGGGGGIGGGGGGGLIASSGRNGTTHGLRGLASYSGDESPPPDYNVVVHDNRHGFFFLFPIYLYLSLCLSVVNEPLLALATNILEFYYGLNFKHFLLYEFLELKKSFSEDFTGGRKHW